MSGFAGDPLAELAALPPDLLMLAHFKQCAARTMLPVVTDGDVDFRRYLAVLEAQGFRGPVVFENPPDPEALENLSSSFAYVAGLVEGSDRSAAKL